jgi:disulfide bond formation protein DsbB
MTANPFAWSFRAQYLAGAVLSFGMIGAALFIEHGMMMMPCPLCILQRIAFATLGVVFLVGGLHAPKGAGGRRAYGLLALLPAGAGAWLAGKHVWIQSLPPSDVPSCNSMGLDYMIEAMGPWQALATALQGSGECAQVDKVLGVSIPVWALLWFVALAGLALWAAFRRR